jgi:hypothetical protein
MASSKPTAAVWTLLIAAATSQPLLPLSRQGLVPQIAERASTEQTWLDNPRYAYMLNVTVGTPGQPMTLAMSVLSPHTWVPDNGARFCLEAALRDPSYPARCGWGTCKSPWLMLQIQTNSGADNATQSTTYSEADEAYRRLFVPYTDGSIMEGTNFTDRLVVDGAATDDIFMGNVHSNTYQTGIGILGLGIHDPTRS